jgi:hypothetical protein
MVGIFLISGIPHHQIIAISFLQRFATLFGSTGFTDFSLVYFHSQTEEKTKIGTEESNANDKCLTRHGRFRKLIKEVSNIDQGR